MTKDEKQNIREEIHAMRSVSYGQDSTPEVRTMRSITNVLLILASILLESAPEEINLTSHGVLTSSDYESPDDPNSSRRRGPSGNFEELNNEVIGESPLQSMKKTLAELDRVAHDPNGPCDLECGNRFFTGSQTCRHGRDMSESIATTKLKP